MERENQIDHRTTRTSAGGLAAEQASRKVPDADLNGKDAEWQRGQRHLEEHDKQIEWTFAPQGHAFVQQLREAHQAHIVQAKIAPGDVAVHQTEADVVPLPPHDPAVFYGAFLIREPSCQTKRSRYDKRNKHRYNAVRVLSR